MEKKYILPSLDYSYNALEPFISEEQLRLHHEKHHKSYVDNANKILEELSEARKNNTEIDIKSKLKFLSFNISGHILHNIFWSIMKPKKEKKNLRQSSYDPSPLILPPEKEEENIPNGFILSEIEKNFETFEKFKKEFSGISLTVEGSGWGALFYEKESGKLIIGQIEKHNLFYYPNSEIIMALDVWEHSYYLDYKNERGKFIENFWNIVNWEGVGRRLKNAMK